MKGRKERRGGREFVLCPRKKKEKSAPMPLTMLQGTVTHLVQSIHDI